MEGRVRTSAYLILIYLVLHPLKLKASDELQPHRAYYTVTMEGRAPLQSNIIDVRGTMMVEVNKVCEGWTVQQLSEIWRYQDDDSVEHVRWGYVTYEADNGSLFKFNTFRKTNGELIENIRGFTRKNGNHVEVIYQKPTKNILTLPEGVLFPLQHTKALLKAAHEGIHMFPQNVFDGSTTEGASEINTFIGAEKTTAGNTMGAEKHQFANQPYWPIRFAVYGMGQAGYEPDYSTIQNLLSNGIITQYVIDDGTVKIRGTLDRVELLSREGC